MRIVRTNDKLRGGRTFPPISYGRHDLDEDEKMALPICKPNGIVENPSPDLFSPETLEAAGGGGRKSGRERS